MPEDTPFDCFAIVEIMGRKVVAGRVTEQVIAGQGFIRVDVPATPDKPAFSQLFGPGSIYAITPTTEEIATAFVTRNVSQPIQPWQLSLPETVIEREPIHEPRENGRFDRDDGDEDETATFNLDEDPGW